MGERVDGMAYVYSGASLLNARVRVVVTAANI